MILRIISVVLLITLVNTAPQKQTKDGSFKMIILHNNDMHARFEQTGMFSDKCKKDAAANNKCYGGFARVAHEVRKYRKQAEDNEIPPVLYLNAGDTYTGTPWFSLYKNNITADFLNILKPDAISLGNHEFDEGIPNLVHFFGEITFPVLSANLDLTKEPTMQVPALKKSHIFTIKDRKIGVIGYLTPDTKFTAIPNGVEYIDEVIAINTEAAKLKADGVNIIIALGHSGIERDKQIAALCPDIDLVIGGHSHTFLYSGKAPDFEDPEGEYPITVTQTTGKKVPVVQCYAFTKYLGYLHLEFDDGGNLIEIDGTPILLNADIPRDSDVLALLELYRPGITALENDIVGHTKVRLDGNCRRKECNLGNFIADSFVDWYANNFEAPDYWTDAAIGFIQGGGVRTSIDHKSAAGVISKEDASTVLPFVNKIVVVEVTGKELLEALEHSVFRYTEGTDARGEFLQMSGAQVTYNLSRPPGSRIVSIKVLCSQCYVPELEAVDVTKVYKVLMQSILAAGADGFNKVLKNPKTTDLQESDANVFMEYLKKKSPVHPAVEWRITIIDEVETTTSPEQSSTAVTNGSESPSTTDNGSTNIPPTTTQGASSINISLSIVTICTMLSLYIKIQFVQEKKHKSKFEDKPAVSYFKLFRFATKLDVFFVFLGIVCASIASLGLPYGMILYGEFTTILVDRTIRIGTTTPTHILHVFGGGRILTNATEEETYDAILEDSKAFGIGCFCGSIIQLIFVALSIDILNRNAQKQISKIRKLFLESVLRQDMAWYDLNTSDSFAVRITDDLDKLKEGIGEKLSIFIYLLMSFVISVVFSFFYGWKLTLVMMTCAPVIILCTAVVAKMQSSLTEKELKSYSSAGSVAEEVLGSIRTVVAFGGETKELNRYQQRLLPAEKNGKKKGVFSGIGGGIMWFIIYCCYALAFWYGISLILADRDKLDKDYTPAVLIIVLFGVLAGAQNMGLTAPHLEAFSTARGSAISIFNVIDRIPKIDSLGDKGLVPDEITGNIVFKDVSFRYPARHEVQVLNGLNLNITAGETVALVGPSGCGKSTCLQLIQRLYDPINGSVSIDGNKISSLNTQWLRSFIGVVGQEPVLFATTIRENIQYGNPDASFDDIKRAAHIANCHGFIMKLPETYETSIGGCQLSGGQKQRIAIARALVRNPKILLLDEATSALDPTSEKSVQDALERASKGRTTLVVSHRLSTITNANKIVFINKGTVAEEGSHEELMKLGGLYFDLVNTNNSTNENSSKTSINSALPSVESMHPEEDEDILEPVSEIDETEIEELKEEGKPEITSLRLFKMNAKEWPYIVSGAIGSILVGASFPAFAVLFGEMYGILSYPDPVEIQNRANFYAILFLALGVMTGIATFVQTYMFNLAGVRLTSRLRTMTFDAMMKQEMGWFDLSNNAIGALCARLSGDCASVQGATGSRIGSILQAGSVIFIGIGISFYYSWKMTLVAAISIPLVLASIVMEARLVQKSNLKEKEAMENATKLAVEAISNIKTVASLGQERHVLNRYTAEIEHVDSFCQKKSRFRGFVFGLGQTVPLMGYGVSLWYGGLLIARKEMHYEDVIKVGEALIFGSWMLGQALAYAPNINVALVSAARIIKLLDRKPKMNNPDPDAFSEVQDTQGDIQYKDVHFRYPTRKSAVVLNGLNLEIKKGQTVALVGESGCGKSTCMQLLLRYYDPDMGKVELDKTSTTDFPIGKIRQKLGLVSQEPILFDRTIAENIAYGDNGRIVPMTEIIASAKAANIHDFISKLPKGYETGLGSKGAQLSGGQKQRIAIARALVRNPDVLLLDEATSALDNQSEKIVQDALETASKGRTCIVIAHRLSTVQNADLIYVLENGQVIEKGNHQNLIKLGQKYAKLYQMQQINPN
ncbi:unnamed protein product [Diamesa hyperborea]